MSNNDNNPNEETKTTEIKPSHVPSVSQIIPSNVKELTIRNLDTGEEYIIGENDPDFEFDTFALTGDTGGEFICLYVPSVLLQIYIYPHSPVYTSIYYYSPVYTSMYLSLSLSLYLTLYLPLSIPP